MTRIPTDRADAIVVGGGIAGITTALELLDQGLQVELLDGQGEDRFGGQARDAFGGMLLVGTPEQHRRRIPDSPELALADWHRAAAFDHGVRSIGRAPVRKVTGQGRGGGSPLARRYANG